MKYKNPWVTRSFLPANQCERLMRHFDATADDHIIFKPQDGFDQEYIDISMNDPEWDLLYMKVWETVTRVNGREWKLALDGYNQDLRIARYGPGGVFDWHLDYTPEDASKVALTIALNSSDDYQGGELSILEASPVPRLKQGHGAIFPAFLGHRVAPVTDGYRYVLLGWFTGPRLV